jgi:hypothetical protein
LKYWLRTLTALALCGGAVLAIDSSLYHLIRTGTCASGGPYVSARPCPPGTGLHIVLLVGGIFGGLIGIAIWAVRGGSARPSRVDLPVIMWSLLFCTIAASAVLAAYGPANNGDDGARTAAIILGLVFIPMGVGPIAMALLGRGNGVSASPIKLTPMPSARPADAISRLERLAELHTSGVLTDAEFEQQKRKLLGEI